MAVYSTKSTFFPSASSNSIFNPIKSSRLTSPLLIYTRISKSLFFSASPLISEPKMPALVTPWRLSIGTTFCFISSIPCFTFFFISRLLLGGYKFLPLLSNYFFSPLYLMIDARIWSQNLQCLLHVLQIEQR